MSRLAAYRWMPTPCCAAGEPLPAIVNRPSTKSVGARRHRQRAPAQLVRRDRAGRRSRCGSAAARTARTCRASPPGGCGTASCAGSRARGAVNAVPRHCSAYRPCATRCGELRPTGKRAGARPRWRTRCRSRTGSRSISCASVGSTPAQPSACRGGELRLGSQHAALHLVALDALEQRLEVAFAEAFVALALDDLEEDRADRVLGEDLQQLALLGLRRRRRSGSCSAPGAPRPRRGSARAGRSRRSRCPACRGTRRPARASLRPSS